LSRRKQARPSSKRGKIKAIKSRAEGSGQLEGNALLQCKSVEEPTAAGRNFCQRRKVRFVQKVPEDGSLPSMCRKAERACNWKQVQKKPAAAGQAFPRADDLSLFSVRTRPDAIDAGIAYKLTMMLIDCCEESVHGLAG
jgi:hypothetical protein